MPHSTHTTPGVINPDTAEVSTLYWNNNVPKEQWTADCPDFLLGQPSKNIAILLRKDSDRKRFDWAQVQDFVRSKNIHHFERCPTQLRAYLEYIHQLKKQYGSVLWFIQHKRLQWDSTTPSGDQPFTNPSDYRVLYNDWPYFIDRDIQHLVVWTKFLIDADENTDEVTDSARAAVEDFVARTFCSNKSTTYSGRTMERDQIRWFRNWKSLKSVHALEHFHIMLYNAPSELLEWVTGGDQPISETWTATSSTQTNRLG